MSVKEKAPRADQIVDYIKTNLSKDIAERIKESTKAAREANKREGINEHTATPDRVAASGVGAQPSLADMRKHFRAKFKSNDSRDSLLEEPTVGQFLRAAGKCGGNFTPQNFEAALRDVCGGDPATAVIDAWRKNNAHRVEKGYSKALGESTFIDGGSIVPPQFQTEVIEYLRAKVVIRALGARVVPMPRGNLTMPYAATGITASTTTENSATPSSQPTFGTFTLLAHKIRAITPVSNELLNDASPEADQFVQQDMVAALRVLEDYNFLRGSGFSGSMVGLRNLAQTKLNASNFAGSAGGSTTTEIIHDLMLMLSGVENLNITIENGGWVLSPRTKNALMALRDGIGNFYFKAEMLQGRLWGHNFGFTTAQPINLDTTSGALSAKESEVLFADFDKVIIGDTQELLVEAFRGGAYLDSVLGSVVSGITNDQTVVAGSVRSDINERFRGASVANLAQVTWGA